MTRRRPMNPFHRCQHVVKKTCLGLIFVCWICGAPMQSPWENRPYAQGTYQTTKQPTPGQPDDGNERPPTGDERTVIDLAGTSITSTATGLGGPVTFDPAKLIRK